MSNNTHQTPLNQVNNAQFLQAISGDDYCTAHVCGFNVDPANAGNAWGGGLYGSLATQVSQTSNQYFCISAFCPAEDGKARRRKSLFKQTNVIVVDDVGLGPSAKVKPDDARLLEPSYKLETSPGNEQWGYILIAPETDRHSVDNLLDGMVAAGITEDGKDPGQKGVTRYVRLPEGTNNKQKYVDELGGPFQCRLTMWEPKRAYFMEQLAAPFNIDLGAVRAAEDNSGVDCEDHPGLAAYEAMFGVKSKLGEGRYDVTCPNVHEHTDEEDTGAAVWTYPDGRLGYKCHHGHCEERGGGWLMNQMFAADPSLRDRVALFGSLLLPPPLLPPPLLPPLLPPPLPLLPIPTGGVPVILDGDTGQVVPDLSSVIFQVNDESDANFMEYVVSQIAAQSGNLAEQSDWVKLLSDQTSRYDLKVLTPMLTQARRALSRQRNTGGLAIDFAHVNDSGNPLSTLANAKLIAGTYGFRFKLNLMTRSVETDRDYTAVPADVREQSNLTDFEDLCMQHRLDDKRVQKHRDRIAFESAYHPFIQYLEIERLTNGSWVEGDIDHISMMAESLELDSFDVSLRDILLKRWLVSVVAAAHLRDESDYMPGETPPKAPRGVLVLQGAQYMGKTEWFQRVIPRGMYKEGLQINLGDMNHMKTATNRLVVEIGEADHATKGRLANYMKTIIGRGVDEVRLAFQKEEVRMVRRNVFCATVNPAEFLDDDQNTRWWPIPLQSINFEQLDRVDTSRLWQQVYTLWEAGEPYHLTRDEMARLNVSNEQFRDVSDFEQFMQDVFDFDAEWKTMPNDKLSWYQATALKKKAEQHGVRNTNDFIRVMKRLTGRTTAPKSNNRGMGSMPPRKYWKLPPELKADPSQEEKIEKFGEVAGCDTGPAWLQ